MFVVGTTASVRGVGGMKQACVDVVIWVVFVIAAMLMTPLAEARDTSWATLHRPLHLAHLAPGSACPVSHVDRSVDFAGYGVAAGIGSGPAYPILSRAVLYLAPAANFNSRQWGGAKVLWFVVSRYDGPVLIRGRRLDGAGLVRFGRGALPSVELRMPVGVKQRPSFTRLRAPGCYAYQIDGTTFSRTIVFRATGAA